MKLTKERTGCYHNDSIDFELNPSTIETIILKFTELALNEKNSYVMQGNYREIADYFKKRYDCWATERVEIDKRNREKKL